MMKELRISENGIEKAVDEANDIIRKGGIVAFPSETFYGLGVKYDNVDALKRLYSIKQRPREKAMPVIIGNRKMLALVASSVNPRAEGIIRRFWPGPLTLLLPARKELSAFITAGSGKVAVRIPGESFARDLARSLDFPITATSANISGRPPADNPADVIRYFADGIDLLVDGGNTPGNMPSTIVDVSGHTIVIVRPGAIPSAEILALNALFR